MKKTLNKVIVTLAAVAALAFGTSAMAATSVSTIDADGKATVTYETTAAAGEQVTVLLLKPDANIEDDGITADEIAYIDQKAAGTDGKVKFEMPISGVTAGQTYALMSGSESATSVTEDDAVFSTGDEPIHYGDVNDDGDIDVPDALEIIKYYLERVEFTDEILLRADVNKDDVVEIPDALEIIKYYLERESTLDDLVGWLDAE